jgi:hypothetical protein
MSKPVTKPQFDQMLERRVNIAARALKEQIASTENNPQFLEAEAAEKAVEFLENAVQALKTHFQLVLTRPQPIVITEFALKPKPAPKAAAAPKAKSTKAPPPAAELDREGVEKLREIAAVTPPPKPKPAPKPAEDDLSEDEIAALLGDDDEK